MVELTALIGKLKGGGNQPAINGPIFSLLRTSADLANLATAGPEDSAAMLEALRKVERATAKVKTTLLRMN